MQKLMVKVVATEALDAEDFYLVLESPELARSAKPGQFVHVSCNTDNGPPRHDPLLRRPISIASVDRLTDRIGLLVRVVGRGTGILARIQAGEFLDLLGPLGSPFPLPPNGAPVLLVGGGVGIAPLFFLAQELWTEGARITTLLGARTREGLFFRERFAGFGAVLTTTEDGSCGKQGYVTSRLAEALQIGAGTDGQSPVVYTCGPRAMMAEVVAFCRREGLQVWVSLEERMACGVGACLVCSCKIRGHYRRVCSDGPVFDGREVDWNA